jgi:hypothetical protein
MGRRPTERWSGCCLIPKRDAKTVGSPGVARSSARCRDMPLAQGGHTRAQTGHADVRAAGLVLVTGLRWDSGQEVQFEIPRSVYSCHFSQDLLCRLELIDTSDIVVLFTSLSILGLALSLLFTLAISHSESMLLHLTIECCSPGCNRTYPNPLYVVSRMTPSAKSRLWNSRNSPISRILVGCFAHRRQRVERVTVEHESAFGLYTHAGCKRSALANPPPLFNCWQ